MRSLASAAALIALACAPALAEPKPTAQPVTDPPGVIGETFEVEGRSFTPADAPFDDVGIAGLAEGIGDHVAAAHRTLPVPSYVEVTALDTGRTVLARVEQRGPMTTSRLVDLSAAAFAQLGADPATPLGVRVRRVNPQEYERALLRTGQRAPERLGAPKPLLEVLRKRLAAGAVTAPNRIAPIALPEASPPMPAQKVQSANAVRAPKAPAVAARSAAAPARGALEVQVAAFANKANAQATAKRLGGSASAAGRVWRVRLGPFAGRAEADAALARARKGGFADARIVSAQ